MGKNHDHTVVQMRSKDEQWGGFVAVNQIEYSRAMMSNSVEKVAYVWTEINKTEEEVADKLTDEDADSHACADSVAVIYFI